MKENKSSKVKRMLIDYILITLGMGAYISGFTIFIVPIEVVPGGVTGISALVNYATDIPMSVTYLTLNSILLVIAIKLLGASFGIKTIWSIGVATIALQFTQGLITEPIVTDPLISTIFGAIIGGAGIGLVFSRGGSTGGTDIVAMILNKYYNISPGRGMMYCDVLIITSVFFISNSVDKVIYGYISMVALSYTIDALLSGNNASSQIFIFSKNFKDIADYINHNTNRGCTVIDATGWYSKENTKLVMTIIRKREATVLIRRIKELDPNAFISVGSVMGVYGEGFDNVKV